MSDKPKRLLEALRILAKECTEGTEFSADEHIAYQAVEHIRKCYKRMSDLDGQIPRWIPVSERLPDATKAKVLATYLNSNGKRRTICAMYIHARTILVEDFYSCDSEPDSDYDEATDTNWVEAGWRECLENWPEYSSLDVCEGAVDFWMPLPAAPAVCDEKANAPGVGDE